jgi:exopolysaccharide biosynthesis polyprenyl glycosylphosphotransferase
VFQAEARQLRRVTVALDVVAAIVAFLGAYWLREALTPPPAAEVLPHLALLALILPVLVTFLAANGAYESPVGAPLSDQARSVVRATAGTLVGLVVLLFALRIHVVSRAIVATFGVLAASLLIGLRIGIDRYLRRFPRSQRSLRRILIVGGTERVSRLAAALSERPESAISILGYLALDYADLGRNVVGCPVLGTVGEVTSILKDHVVDEVIVTLPAAEFATAEAVSRACEEEGIRVRFSADFLDAAGTRVSLDSFGGIPLLTFEAVARDRWKLFLKQALDLGVAAIALPPLLPLMVLIGVAVKFDSPGPALFVQDRVGLNKRRFRMLKFRTMRDGSERLQDDLEPLNQATGPAFKIFDDPRVTRVGRILRRTSLDELPQLFNVIRTDMSLVGPRPMSLRDVGRFDQSIQRKRFSVKPGMTGLWQVSGRSTLSFARWLELDLWYIEHWSLWLDVKILLKTIPMVVKGTGAA